MATNKERCQACDGEGYFLDTTYDRCGVTVRCGRCHGSGLNDVAVREIIDAAFAPHLKPRPKD
jgi:DnaJ-class molecular chaperone